MKKTRLKKSLSFIVCIVLIAVMALFTIGCNDNKESSNSETIQENACGGDTIVSDSNTSQSAGNVLGVGNTKFTFTVTDVAGKETVYEIHTDKTKVGDALLELNLIAGENGPYGLYIKTVNGITVDYNTDGKYWAFYVDGKYAQAGVDLTNIVDGATYSFKAE